KLIVDGSDHIIAEPNRTIKVYVRGGKPNVKIQWSFSGDVDIGDKQNKFDQNGEASVVLIAKAPYKKDIVVKAESLNQTLNKTITYVDGTIYTPKIEYPSYKVSFWKTLDKTIDYDS
ncbi:hypothetical protein DO002_07745, partial [Campylobacter lari]|nr:hypothetical protein [Campylobacter lari]